MSDIAYERRKAVAEAWKKEKEYVLNGKGTRDWSPKEQRELVSKGKVAGYQGHHMKSVDGHNSKAGNPDNIQFLTRKEHLAAHKGNFHNNTNGRYDPATGNTNEFGRYNPSNEAKDLTNPKYGPDKGVKTDKAAESVSSKAKEKANNTERRSVSKTKDSKHRGETKPKNESAGKTQSKTLAKQRASRPSGTSKTASKSKTLSRQQSSKKDHGRSH